MQGLVEQNLLTKPILSYEINTILWIFKLNFDSTIYLGIIIFKNVSNKIRKNSGS